MSKKILLTVFAVVSLMLTVAASGCVDIELTKDFFMPPRPVEIKYTDTWYNVSHEFNTTLKDPNSLVYQRVVDVEVPNGTVYIDTRVKVVIPSLSSLPENVSNLIENLSIDREVNVTLFKPDNTVYYSKVFNQTTPHPVALPRVPYPENGTWHLLVKAEGIGNENLGIHDSFSVALVVHHPVEKNTG